MEKERGANATFVAVITVVVVGLGIWVFSQSKSAIWDEPHADLARVTFDALKADDFDKYADKMISVWDALIDEAGYQAHYKGMEKEDGREGLRKRLRDETEGPFAKAREDAASDFDWSEAEYDGPMINKAPVTWKRLLGLYVKANGKRYQFGFLNPQPCLHVPIYRGLAK